MGQHISTPLAFVELTTTAGETVVTPLAFPEVAWLGSSARSMARKLARAVQAELIDDGRYLDAVRIVDPPAFERHDIEVDLPAGREALLQPAMRRRYVAFLSMDAGEQRGLGCVPALGIVAIAEPERLREAVIEAIQLEHRRSARQSDTRRQVAAHWYEHIELVHQPLELLFHTAEELRRLQDQNAEPLLSAVAEMMFFPERAAVGLGPALETLTRAAEGAFARSVLVVGAEGSGKTALVHHYVRDRSRRGVLAPWETSAARLIQGLTRDGGWQHPLALLCHEIAQQDAVLYVGHLAELFEVGQYQGNAVSLGDALREPLARGRLMLLAEATPAELARIELRSPGFAALFQQVRMPEPAEAEQERIMVEAVSSLAVAHKVEVLPAAVAEVIGLQRRFSPYSGFPGKGIRFFEELILHARGRTKVLGRDQALDAFCSETGMPRRMLDPQQPLDLAEVQSFFERRLFGQPDAIRVAVGVLASIKTGLSRTGKPIASMLLIGPTGVGKTETAKALAEFMFGDARRMIRIDMSEYADPAAVLRLLGDLDGGEGVLVGAVRRQPFSVVLFDELEKAHTSFFDLLLQVLGEGRLTGGDGLTANFCGTIVVMTSNLGAEVMQRAPMGMATRREDPRRHFEQAVQDAFRPELFNRIDHIVPFAVLSAAERAPIFQREVSLMRRREGILERSVELDLADDLPARLAAQPGDPRYGARDVQRVLRQQVLLPLAQALAPHPYVQPVKVKVAAEASGKFMVRADMLQRPTDLAPLQTADALADARRRWQRVAEGPLYINLVNQVFRLDKERRAHDKKRRKLAHLPHWDNTEGGARERELQAVRQSADALLGEVMALESEALLALVGEPVSPPDPSGWQRRFLAFKQRTFQAVRPASGICTVGLYAAPRLLDILFPAFTELAQLAGLTVKVQVVRMSDEPPPKPPRPRDTAPFVEHDEDDEDKEKTEPLPPPYLVYPWPQVGGKKTLIVGFELELRGPAVYDYFRAEGGVWRVWEGDRKSNVWVSVHNLPLEEFKSPAGVHRQHFFDGLEVHRHLKEGRLSDPRDDWHCAFPHSHEWKLQLDRTFGTRVDRMLLGEDE